MCRLPHVVRLPWAIPRFHAVVMQTASISLQMRDLSFLSPHARGTCQVFADLAEISSSVSTTIAWSRRPKMLRCFDAVLQMQLDDQGGGNNGTWNVLNTYLMYLGRYCTALFIHGSSLVTKLWFVVGSPFTPCLLATLNLNDIPADVPILRTRH